MLFQTFRGGVQPNSLICVHRELEHILTFTLSHKQYKKLHTNWFYGNFKGSFKDYMFETYHAKTQAQRHRMEHLTLTFEHEKYLTMFMLTLTILD